MKVLTVWGLFTRLTGGLLLIAALVLAASSYLPLIRQAETMRKRILVLQQEVQTREAQHRQKRTLIEALRNDPGTVERMARDRLGFAKPGETVVHFDDGPAP